MNTTDAVSHACDKPAAQSAEYEKLPEHDHENINAEIHEFSNQHQSNIQQNVHNNKMMIHMTLTHAAVLTQRLPVRP